MKKLIILLTGTILITVVAGSQVGAQSFSFGDDYPNWPGQIVTDTGDMHGNFPKVNGMTVNINDNKILSSVIISIDNRHNYGTDITNFTLPDSLFINTDTAITSTNWKSCTWDYYVRDSDKENPHFDQVWVPSTNWWLAFLGYGHYENVWKDGGATLYSVKPTDQNFYTYADGYTTRDDHANGIKDKYLEAKVNGFNVIYDNGLLTYNFLGFDILMGDNWTIGYTPQCANDVILGVHKYETPNNPVPEPATMLLFGVGLIGLAGVIRKRKTV